MSYLPEFFTMPRMMTFLYKVEPTSLPKIITIQFQLNGGARMEEVPLMADKLLSELESVIGYCRPNVTSYGGKTGNSVNCA